MKKLLRDTFILILIKALVLSSCYKNDPSPVLCTSLPQFSLLSEVRGLVTPQDLEHFDGLVLRREIQALKARQVTAGATALQPDSASMVSYPDTLTSSSASFLTNTTLSSARVGWTHSHNQAPSDVNIVCVEICVYFEEKMVALFSLRLG